MKYYKTHMSMYSKYCSKNTYSLWIPACIKNLNIQIFVVPLQIICFSLVDTIASISKYTNLSPQE